MVLSGVREGDVVLVDKKGRKFMALVTEKRKGELAIKPFDRSISYFSCTSREVESHWKKMGRNGA